MDIFISRYKSFYLIMFIAVVVSLTGCRITGGSSGKKSSGVKTWSFSARDSKPIKLSTANPKIKFRVFSETRLGDFKQHYVTWTRSLYLNPIKLENEATIHIAIYKSDGITLLSEKDIKIYPTIKKTRMIQIIGLSEKIQPGKLQSNLHCNNNANSCKQNRIVDIQLVKGKVGPYLNLENNISVVGHTKLRLTLFSFVISPKK